MYLTLLKHKTLVSNQLYMLNDILCWNILSNNEIEYILKIVNYEQNKLKIYFTTTTMYILSLNFTLCK